jgi:hypothetical protein
LVGALIGVGAPLVPVVHLPRADATGAGYAQSVLEDDPVAYWRLGEGTGTALDRSSNGNAGTYVGGTSSTEGISGATRFDGSSGYVRVPDSSTLNQPTNGITLEAWISPSAGNTSQKTIVQKAFTSHSWPFYQYGLFMYSGHLTFYLALNGQFISMCPGSTFLDTFLGNRCDFGGFERGWEFV